MGDSRIAYVSGGRPTPSNDCHFDIVFVHGLTGDSRETWTNAKGDFWPQWLAEDYPTTNVYSVGYQSSFFASILKGGGASLLDQATILLDTLLSRPTSNRPVLFITHSLGGLIVKQMLRGSSDASNHRRKRLCGNTCGVVFIATPHQGAHFANVVNNIIHIGTSTAVKGLANGHEPLLDLGKWFSNWATDKRLPVECYYEVEKYRGVLVVDKTTVDPHVYGCDPVAVQTDHVSITKIESRHAHLYRSVRAVVADLLPDQSKDDGGASGSSGNDEIIDEFKSYTEPAAIDRRTLAQKLSAANRANEIGRGEQQKEKFSMMLQRGIAHPSAVRRYTKLMSNIQTRFHRHVMPAICEGAPPRAVDELVQNSVLDPSQQADNAESNSSTAAVVESAYYYLAGNCHIGWDDV